MYIEFGYMKFSNQEIAQLLRKVAAAYEIKGGDKKRFKIIAYQRAADAIEHATSEVKDLWDEGRLATLPGVGKSIAQHLDELFRTGKVRHFNLVMKGLPEAMFPLIEIPGFGPKTAYRLVTAFKIKNQAEVVEKLIGLAESHQIQKLEGFGAKLEVKILESLKEYQKKRGQHPRMLLFQALRIAEEIITYLKEEKSVLKINPLGSLRRRVATVGDIDIAVATDKPEKVMKRFLSYPKIKKVLVAGKAKISVVLENRCQIDLRIQEPKSYGSLLQYFTGSKHHNIHLREIAQRRGLSLSEYGIKKQEEGRWILEKYADEKSFYRALGMDWIPPELREDRGEIEAAISHSLPVLVEGKEIRGDLHLHSSFDMEPSHDLGTDSIEEMVEEAETLGYEYLAFTEHNPSRSKHTNREICALIQRRNSQIEQVICSRGRRDRNRVKKVFKMLEIDILPDGNLAIPNSALALLDGAIAAIHTAFKMSKKEMTERILKALANPVVKIFAHPTGRLLNKREGYEVDWDRIFRFCLEYDKALEINAYPSRLDLPDGLVREAIKRGVKLVINTDAHAREEMALMRFGVFVARRGWAKRGDILNTLGYNELERWLGKRK